MGMLISSLGVLVKKKNQKEYFFDFEIGNEEVADLVANEDSFSSIATSQDIIQVIEQGFVLRPWDEDEPAPGFDEIIEDFDYAGSYDELKSNILKTKSVDKFEYIILLTNETLMEGKIINWIKYTFDDKKVYSGENRIDAYSNGEYKPSEDEVFDQIRNKA